MNPDAQRGALIPSAYLHSLGCTVERVQGLLLGRRRQHQSQGDEAYWASFLSRA
jgi:hypothetical protein